MNPSHLLPLLLALPALAGTPPEPPSPVPQLSAPLGSGLSADLNVENGRLRRGTFYDPQSGLELELGDLGAGSGSPLLGRSPYFSLGRDWSGSGRLLDWEVRGRLSAVDLGARWFDSIPERDPLLRDGTPGAGDPTAFSSETLYFGSVLGRVGRAFSLWGPVDLGWSLQGIARADHYFPTLSLDQTLGARLRLPDEQNVGVFGGVTEGVAVLSRDWAARAVTRDANPLEPKPAVSPHVELGAWGPLAGDTGYQAWAGRQQDPNTHTDRLSAALTRPALGGTLSAGLRSERETGDGIAFDRREDALRLSLARRSGVEFSVEAGRRDIDYGGANFSGNFVQFGITIREKPRGDSVTLSARSSGGRLEEARHQWARDLQAEIGRTAAAADRLLAQAEAALAGADPARAVAELRAAYEALPPDFRSSLDERLGGPPDFDRLLGELSGGLDEGSAAAAAERARLAALRRELADPARLEKVLTRQLRLQLYEALKGTELRLWGRQIPLTPPLLLTLVHAYGQGQGLIPPVDSRALTPALDRWLVHELENRYGAHCPGDLLSCATSALPPELQERLKGVPEARAREIIASALGVAADSIRLEMNRYLLSVYLSAKALDQLTVERGESPGTLARRGVVDSFARLDERRSPRPPDLMRRALEEGARRLAEEAERQRATMLEDARARGRALRAEFAAAGIALEEEGLEHLVLDYGEESLRTFAAEAGAKLAAKGRTDAVLRYSPDTLLGLSVIHETSGRIVLTLPPASGRNPGRLLDALSNSLDR